MALRHARPHRKEFGIRPEQNLRMTAEAECRDFRLRGFDWSIMQFHPFQVGRLAIDCLEAAIQTAGDELVSLAHQATWREEVHPPAFLNPANSGGLDISGKKHLTTRQLYGLLLKRDMKTLRL